MAALKAIDLVEKDFLKIDKETPLSKLIGQMVSSKKDSALVFDRDSFLGIVSRKAFAQKRISDPSKIKVAGFVESSPVLSPNDSLEQAAELLFSSDARILPVMRGGNLLGVISSLGLAKNISSLPEFKKRLVTEAMEKTIVLKKDSTVAQAIASMRETNTHVLPVVNEQSRLVGVVSLAAIVEKFLSFPKSMEGGSGFTGKLAPSGFSEKSPVAKTPVSNEMVENFTSVSPSETISKASALMFSKGIHNLVVEEESVFLGIVPVKNILGLALKSKQQARNIQVSNLPELDEIDKAKAMALLEKTFDKLERIYPEEVLLRAHFKEQSKTGARKKHLVQLKFSAPGKTSASEASDWNFLSALQDAAKSLEREIMKSTSRSRET